MRNIPAMFLVITLVLALCGCVSSPSPSATPAPTAMPTPTAAPAPTIHISGVALDPRGAPVPYARVALWEGDHLVNASDSIQYTNSAGQFNFTDLPPAQYQITADIQGHQGQVDQYFNDSASIQVVITGYAVPGATAVPSPTPVPANMPHFEVTRLGPTTVEFHLTSFGGVTTLKGFYVKSPAIATPEIVAVDKPLGESWTATVTDPNLRPPVQIVASSWVNGNYAEVVNTSV